jgi:hypothetical protein
VLSLPMFDGKTNVSLDLLDTGGGLESNAVLRNQWFQAYEAILICSAFDEPDCLSGLDTTYRQIQVAKDLDAPIVVVVRTKCDAGDFVVRNWMFDWFCGFHCSKLQNQREVLEWVREHNTCLVSTSALQKINVQLPFQLAVCAVMNARTRKGAKKRGD